MKMEKRFCRVRDKLNTQETRNAYRLAYKKPWRFYKEHTPSEAIKILKEEAENAKIGKNG